LIDLRLGDCLDRLREMPGGSVQTCVTSPPYFALRDYGVDGQIGLEPTVGEYVAKMVEVFAEVRRVLRDDGTLFLNLGDSYGAGKQLVGVPWRVAFALQESGYVLRSDIIWAKPNPMPESVRDRPTKSHEYLFLLAKSDRYMYDADGVREHRADSNSSRHEAIKKHGSRGAEIAPRGPKQIAGSPYSKQSPGHRGVPGVGTTWLADPAGRNARTVWTITPRPFKGSHFATMPVELAERCIKAGTGERGACPTCGKAWERVVERDDVVAARGNEPCKVARGMNGNSDRSVPGGYCPRIATLGHRTACTCPAADPVPCVVLDPFSGAGTTGVACVRLGRSYIGLELNPAYLEMSRARIDAEIAKAPLLNPVA
jgi:DNA modification methylase